jgi:hypothetical protein
MQHIHWKQFSSLIFMKTRSVLWLAQSPKLFILVAQKKKEEPAVVGVVIFPVGVHLCQEQTVSTVT